MGKSCLMLLASQREGSKCDIMGHRNEPLKAVMRGRMKESITASE